MLCCSRKVAGNQVIKNSCSATLLAGRCLLEVAQHCECVAPVAFMIGSVIQACRRAQVLKEDCAEFARVIETVEVALCKCKDLGSRKDVIDKIQVTLDSAMGHVTLCVSRGGMGRLLYAADDTDKFQRMSQELHNACSMLQFDQVLELKGMIQNQYKESESLNKLIMDKGGAEKVSKDESLLSEVLSTMNDKDRLNLELVNDAKRESQKSNEGIQDIKAAMMTQNEHLSELFSSYNDAAKNASSEIMIMKQQNDLLTQQVLQMQHMMAEQSMKMTQFMSMFPVCHDDAYRQRVIDSRKLYDLEITPHCSIGKIAMKALAECKLGLIAFSVVQRETSMFPFGFLWVPDSHKFPKGREPPPKEQRFEVPGRSGGYVVVYQKLGMPRKCDSCQYTVASPKKHVQALEVWKDEGFQKVMPDRYCADQVQSLASVVPEIDKSMKDLMSHPQMNVVEMEFDIMFPGDDHTKWDMLYQPYKVHVDDRCVGSMCFLYETIKDGELDSQGRGRSWNAEEVAKGQYFTSLIEQEIAARTDPLRQ